LLHAISQIFGLHQVFHQSRQNLRQRTAGFTSRHHVYVERRKNPRELAQRSRETAAVDQCLMQCVRHLLDARMLQALFQDRQSLVERHSRLKQVAKLLGKNQQLSVRNFQILRWCFACRSSGFLRRLWRGCNDLDFNRDAALLLNLVNRYGAVRAVEHTLDQATLGITRTISKLRHGF
jgi:hypothetical protein